MGGYAAFGRRAVASKGFKVPPHYKLKINVQLWKYEMSITLDLIPGTTSSCRSMLMDTCGRPDGTTLRVPSYADHKILNGMMPFTTSNSFYLTTCQTQISCSHQHLTKMQLMNHGVSETSSYLICHVLQNVECVPPQTLNNVTSGLRST